VALSHGEKSRKTSGTRVGNRLSLRDNYAFLNTKKSPKTLYSPFQCYDGDKVLSNLFANCSVVNDISHPETVGKRKCNQCFLAH